MKRSLSFLGLGLLATGSALADGPTIIGSIYAPSVEVGSADASPDAIHLEIRQPLNRNFWVGAGMATAFGKDTVSPGVDVEIGNSVSLNLGLAHEFAHHMEAYAYIGYGKAEVDATGGGLDGNGVGFGLGANFLLNDHLLVDVGYASLFDDDMDASGGGTVATSIAGPRVGLGFRF